MKPTPRSKGNPHCNESPPIQFQLESMCSEWLSEDLSNLDKKDRKIAEVLCKFLTQALTAGFQIVTNKITDSLRKFEEKCINQKKEIDDLKDEVTLLKKDIDSLKANIDDQDQLGRKNSVILSGNNLPEATPNEVPKKIALDSIKNHLNMVIKEEDIATVYRLGPKPTNQTSDRRPLLIKLYEPNIKSGLIYASRNKPRHTSLFINENLTPERRAIFYALRRMKKDGLISGCTTMDGKLFAFTKAPITGQRDVRHRIASKSALSEFCTTKLRCELDNYLSI